MSFFESQTPGWAQTQPGREQSYEAPQGPFGIPTVKAGHKKQQERGLTLVLGTSSPSPPVDASAFNAQFEEIQRVTDNLVRNGKVLGGEGPARQDSMIPAGAFAHQHPGFYGNQRDHSNSHYDGMRSHSSHSSSSVQGYVANQRYGGGGRQSEAEQMMQAKRRAAAQRERDLRNYHQEQQYNRNVTSAKTERAMSPNAMNEEERRELIARQHRALYGDGASLYSPDGSRPVSQDARVLAGQVAPTPNLDGYGAAQGAADSSVPGQQSGEGMVPKSTNPASTFAMFDNSQQPARTSTSSPGGDTTAGAGVGLIGSRVMQVAGLKRNSPPSSSPLAFGAKTMDGQRSTSAASNPAVPGADGKPVGLGWGAANNGPWGPNKPSMGGMQAPVWG